MLAQLDLSELVFPPHTVEGELIVCVEVHKGFHERSEGIAASAAEVMAVAGIAVGDPVHIGGGCEGAFDQPTRSGVVRVKSSGLDLDYAVADNPDSSGLSVARVASSEIDAYSAVSDLLDSEFDSRSRTLSGQVAVRSAIRTLEDMQNYSGVVVLPERILSCIALSVNYLNRQVRG